MDEGPGATAHGLAGLVSHASVGQGLEGFDVFGGHYLLSENRTGVFSSQAVHCVASVAKNIIVLGEIKPTIIFEASWHVQCDSGVFGRGFSGGIETSRNLSVLSEQADRPPRKISDDVKPASVLTSVLAGEAERQGRFLHILISLIYY